jgi:hypothetical protein
LISAADDVASSPQTGGVGLLNGVTLGHALPDTSSPVRGSCKRVPKQGSVTDFGVRRMNRGNKQQGSKQCASMTRQHRTSPLSWRNVDKEDARGCRAGDAR